MIVITVPGDRIVGVEIIKAPDGLTHVCMLERADLSWFTRSSVFPPIRGSWFRASDGTLTYCCRVCGKISGHNPSIHTVAPDGCVSPSWICPHGCGAHWWVRLNEWTATTEESDADA